MTPNRANLLKITVACVPYATWPLAARRRLAACLRGCGVAQLTITITTTTIAYYSMPSCMDKASRELAEGFLRVCPFPSALSQIIGKFLILQPIIVRKADDH
jgi:hypothetical protein